MANQLSRLFVLLIVIGAGHVAAQDCKFPNSAEQIPRTQDQLLRLARPECAGDKKNDEAQLVQDIAKLTADYAAPEPKAPIKVVNVIRAVLERLTQFAGDRILQNVHATQWAAIHSELTMTRSAFARSISAQRDEGTTLVQEVIPDKWADFGRSHSDERSFDAAGVAIKPLETVVCPVAADQPCPMYDSQIDMLRVAYIMAQMLKLSHTEDLQKSLSIAQRELARWETYRSGGQHQYFWELWVNGKWMSSDLCTKKTDNSGNRVYVGFCEVPTSQWIVAHPDVGLRWSRSAKTASELKPTFLIETLGWYRWDWKSKIGPDAAKMESRLGASLATAFTQHVDGRSRWSWGPMFHINGYNLSVTKGKGESWSLLISTGLVERYFDIKETAIDKLKALEK
jgi:hypothetical protein